MENYYRKLQKIKKDLASGSAEQLVLIDVP